MTDKKYLYLVETDRGHRYTIAIDPNEAFEKVKAEIKSLLITLDKITVVAEEGINLVL